MEGTEFAGHMIEEEIGRGGMGIVYRARHIALDRTRALKILSPELSGDETYVARFRRESRLAASVEHPAVVVVHHAGEENGRLYMSMQFIDGADLGRMLADGPLAPRRAAAILGQLAAGLDAAHAAGLIHRDVKPENVLLSGGREDERAFLTDFGIGTVAEAADGASTRLTTRGIVLGTSGYIAPEQISGEALDSRADVYSLGCVAFNMLTGRAPFAGRSDLATLSAHGSAPRPMASELDPSLGAGVDAAIAAAMAIDPDDRPDSAGEFAARLDSALRNRDGTRDAPTRPMPEPTRRSRRWIPTAIVIGILITAAGAALLVAGGSGDDPGDAPASAEVTTLDTPRDPVAVAAGADRAWVAGRDSDIVTALGFDGDRPLGRGGSIENPRALALGFGYLWAVGRDGLFRIPLDTGNPERVDDLADPSDVAVDGDFVWVLDRGDQPRVVRFDPVTLEESRAGFVGSDPRSLAAGAGSIWVTNTGDGTVSQVDPDTARPIDNPIEVGGRPTNVAARSGEVWVVDNFGGRLIPIDPSAPSGSPQAGEPVATAPRPRGLAVGSGSVWVSSGEDGIIQRFAADSPGDAPETIAVGSDPADVDIGAGSVWTANQGDSTLSRITP